MKIIKTKTLDHFEERDGDTIVDTIIVHSSYTPSWYDSTCNPFDPDRCIRTLDEHGVSCHFIISRDGEIYQLVDPLYKAFHAGESVLPNLAERVNNPFSLNNQSLGIELIASETSGFTNQQMQSLIDLVIELSNQFSIKYILGHEHVSPERKTDPGPLFKWVDFKKSLLELSFTFSTIQFPA